MTKTIHVETMLPTSADRVWSAMKQPATMLYVLRGIAGFPALNGRPDPVEEGEKGSGWLMAFHVIPSSRHTIEVLRVDEENKTIQTHEYGGVLKRWDHTLHVESVSENQSRYSDTVEIDARALTGFVARLAQSIYRYRQRRWHKLVNKHLLPEGRSYRLK